MQNSPSHAIHTRAYLLDETTIPAPEGLKVGGESGIIVDGSTLLSIARYGARPLALVSKSTNHNSAELAVIPLEKLKVE